MRAGVACLFFAACGFHPTLDTVGDGPNMVGSDAVDVMKDAAADTTLSAAPCHITDPDLVLCLEFDEPGLAAASHAIDGSGRHHDPTISGITLTTRTTPTTSQAIQTSGASSLLLPVSTDFALQRFTLMAWIDRSSATELGIVDTGGQYTMSISNSSNHEVECALSHNQVLASTFAGTTSTTEWDLVACTYDGAQICGYVWRNGAVTQNCSGISTTIDTNGTAGTSVASWADLTSHFIGKLDQIRIFGRALDQTAICTMGGLSGC